MAPWALEGVNAIDDRQLGVHRRCEREVDTLPCCTQTSVPTQAPSLGRGPHQRRLSSPPPVRARSEAPVRRRTVVSRRHAPERFQNRTIAVRQRHSPITDASCYSCVSITGSGEYIGREEAVMPTPFPGMDPWLERRGIWEQVHTGLIVSIQRFLTPLLRPRYHVGIEERTYLAILPPDEQHTGIPDVLITGRSAESGGLPSTAAQRSTARPGPVVAELPVPEEIKERYLEIRTVPDQQVVTIIEILSPTNKLAPEGREQYERKRFKVLGSWTNLVEIDLGRAGQPLPMKAPATSDYRIVVSRSRQRPRADVYLFGLRDPVPSFPVPLRPGEAEPELPLDQLLHEVYDLGGFDLVIDYRIAPEPALSEADSAWAASLLSSSKQPR